MDYRNWYAVSINMNKEKSTKAQLLARRALFHDTHLEEVEYLERKELKVLKGGKRRVQTRLLMPGYMLVKVKKQEVVNEDGTKETIFPPDTFDLITQTPGIKFFVNCDNLNPLPSRPREVKRMFDMCDDAHLEVKQNVSADYQEGDILDVVDGPFAGFKCEVISLQGQKIMGQLDMFGRQVPAEFSYDQVYKK